MSYETNLYLQIAVYSIVVIISVLKLIFDRPNRVVSATILVLSLVIILDRFTFLKIGENRKLTIELEKVRDDVHRKQYGHGI